MINFNPNVGSAGGSAASNHTQEALKANGVTKQQLKEYLWEHSRIPASAFPDSYYRDEIEPLDDPNWVPLCKKSDQFIIIVGGGAGRHSIYIPTFAASISITRVITSKRKDQAEKA